MVLATRASRRGVHGLTVGATVCCPRGYKVGIVAELQEQCFRLSAPSAPEFWLGKDTVASVNEGIVQLRIKLPREESEGWNVPPHSGIHIHVGA